MLGNLQGRGLLQVQSQRTFPLVVLVEVAAAVEARLVIRPWRQQTGDARAGGSFDANYLGTEVRELQGAERPGPDPGKVSDADAGEGEFVAHRHALCEI